MKAKPECTKCTECRYKLRNEAEKRSLLNRLKRVEGQVRGLQTMVDSDTYCIDILMQVQAVRAALSAFSREILSNHIATCVEDNIRNGDKEAIRELTDVLYKMMK
ncbi:MAG: metal-sensing transcriptional repressor [Eubacteriales bacterium]|nr:metal-sensing transcriptional repressor [Eubacteriales bacterium]MDD4104737.1 metal-sensing transcriptional repressor [Eubacteriales bacterium]MDD4711475.1 metal-sensing transcriptional repressor [Eubacteriales bacterium]NLO16480.1 metal-sensing transcriptional repressor [Clostridiales bacterium]